VLKDSANRYQQASNTGQALGDINQLPFVRGRGHIASDVAARTLSTMNRQPPDALPDRSSQASNRPGSRS